MSQCNYCGTTILFGGVKDEGRNYCNATCHRSDGVARHAQTLPAEVVQRAVAEVAAGPCPVCKGPGPVEVFTSYRVTSLVVVTTWKSSPRISCRGCATKAQLLGTLHSFFLGWWGIPWGFVMTPVQIVRNLAGLSREANPSRPSALLEMFVRMQLAGQSAVVGAAGAANSNAASAKRAA